MVGRVPATELSTRSRAEERDLTSRRCRGPHRDGLSVDLLRPLHDMRPRRDRQRAREQVGSTLSIDDQRGGPNTGMSPWIAWVGWR